MLSFFLIASFILASGPGSASLYAYQKSEALPDLPAPGTLVTVSEGFSPTIIKGLTVHPENPLQFDFIIDNGDENLEGEAFNDEVTKQVKYFLTALTIPEEDMWVNLSVHEENRIVPDEFGKTLMGRDLLAQDYMLKQLTASLIHPDSPKGKIFWNKVYERAQKQYGTTDIPVNTFNKVWIVPQRAEVFESGPRAFVVGSYLKVMLEEDYIAKNAHYKQTVYSDGDAPRRSELDALSSDIFREVILPEIEKEVNTGKMFAALRQISNAMILATWYKRNIWGSLLGDVYVDKNKTTGVDVHDKAVKNRIHAQYVESFRKGVFDFIKEDVDPRTNTTLPRKYFSGGAVMLYSPVYKENTGTRLPNIDNDGSRSVRVSLRAFSPAAANAAMLSDEELFSHDIKVRSHIREIPTESREEEIEMLKDRVIAAIPVYLQGGQWGKFLNLFDVYEFSPEQRKEIYDAYDFDKTVSEEETVSSRDEFFNSMRNLGSNNWEKAAVTLRNVLAYMRVYKPELMEGKMADVHQAKSLAESSVKEAIHKIRGSENLYPLFRQIIREMFLIPSSKTAEINELMRIAEREVNVSTHKGQDILSVSGLRRILESDHQRRRSGPGGTFDVEVTRALTRLLELVTELTEGTQDVMSGVEDDFFDDDTKDELAKANELYEAGRRMEALFTMTEARRVLKEKIVSTMRAAEAHDHSDVRRYGRHIDEARELAEEAYSMMEMEIVLAHKIVDLSSDVFENVKIALDRNPRDNDTLKEVILSFYIIAENMAKNNEEGAILRFFIGQLLDLYRKGRYDDHDLIRIYGLVSQVRSILNRGIVNRDDLYKWRVEDIQHKRGEEAEDSSEALAFTQDLLTSSILNQFTERLIFSVETKLYEVVNNIVPGVDVDPVTQENMQRAVVLPEASFAVQDRVVNLRDGDFNQLKRIGSKAYGLKFMHSIGLPTVGGFAVLGDAQKRELGADLGGLIDAELDRIEAETKKKLGDENNPLLVSVRSSFPVSLAGEFDTVTNIGINDTVYEALAQKHGSRFALETNIRFLRSLAKLFIDGFEGIDGLKGRQEEELEVMARELEALLAEHGIHVPDNPRDQVKMIMDRIMHQPMRDISRMTLALHGIPEDWLVNTIIQEMKFGNAGEGSYTAVVYTRDLNDGSSEPDVETMYDAQGEDLVGDIRANDDVEDKLPEADDQVLRSKKAQLEKEFGPTELELTRESQFVNFLQARTARLNSPEATVRAYRDMVAEGILTAHQAEKKIRRALEESVPDVVGDDEPLTRGLGVSGGAIAGKIAFSIEKALELTRAGQHAILVLEFTPPRDVRDVYTKQVGVITAHGGKGQHYAVWARRLGRPYLTMPHDLTIDEDEGTVTIAGQTFREGDSLTMHGNKGLIWAGELDIKHPQINKAMLGDSPEDQSQGELSPSPYVAAIQRAYKRLKAVGDLAKLKRMHFFQILDAIGAIEIKDPGYSLLDFSAVFSISESDFREIIKARAAFRDRHNIRGEFTPEDLYKAFPQLTYMAPEQRGDFPEFASIHPEKIGPGVYYHRENYRRLLETAPHYEKLNLPIIFHELLEAELGRDELEDKDFHRYFVHGHPYVFVGEIFLSALLGREQLDISINNISPQLEDAKYSLEVHPSRARIYRDLDDLIKDASRRGINTRYLRPESVEDLNRWGRQHNDEVDARLKRDPEFKREYEKEEHSRQRVIKIVEALEKIIERAQGEDFSEEARRIVTEGKSQLLFDPLLLPAPNETGKNEAMLSKPRSDKTPGGINLNAQYLNMDITRGSEPRGEPVFLQPIHNVTIDGFMPVIINITPVTNLHLLFGTKEDAIKYDDLSLNLN